MCYGVFMCAVYSRKISPDFTDDFRWLMMTESQIHDDFRWIYDSGILLRSMLSKKIQMIVSEERSDEGNNHLTMMLSETKHHPAIMNPWCLNRRFMMKLWFLGFNSDQELLCNRNWMFPKSECDEGNIQFPVVGEQRESPTDQFGPFIFFDFCLVSVQLPRCRYATPDATRITRSLFARSFYA